MGDNPVYKGTIKLYKDMPAHPPIPAPNLYAPYCFSKDYSFEMSGYHKFKSKVIWSLQRNMWFCFHHLYISQQLLLPKAFIDLP